MPNRIKIHQEGHRILWITGVLFLVINLILSLFFRNWMVWLATGSLSLLVVFCFAYFFRLPIRNLIRHDQKVIAPADGKIVVIEEVQEPEYFGDKRIQVSIFMSPTNVHVNRSPISGVVKYQKYHPGKYLVAWHPKSSEKNERNSVVISNDSTEVLIRQIAGKLARKIRWYLQEGDTTEQGAELGFIKFGSRVDLFLPVGTKIEVDLKQKVKGGITIIGTLPEQS